MVRSRASKVPQRLVHAWALALWVVLAIAAGGCDDPAVAACGNGVADVREACDDGNLVDGDGCDSNCTITACGNGIATADEACDDGNYTDGDGCDTSCTPSACGNGVPAAGERCDDGNRVDGDGCDSNCTPTACGNAVRTGGEACDDGNRIDGDGCDTNCTPSACGNGIQAPGEACDDGNRIDGDGCDSDCERTGCGNGIATAGEACDDGNLVEGDGCDTNCTVSACGNGVAASSEACDDGNLVEGDGCDTNCTLTRCGNGIATAGEACDDGDLTNGDGCDVDCTASLRAYVKASNTGGADQFGSSIALSADGSTLAVGVPYEDSAATGVGGDQADNSATSAGAVYVFVRRGTQWSQQAYLKASNTGANDLFGSSVALSADGSILAVGAQGEDGAATGIGGNQADNSAADAGAVYVFARSGTTWSQAAYVKASNTGAGDAFGFRVALSGDGATLAVAAVLEDSAANGIGGNQADNSAASAGAVYVFTRSGATWSQSAYLKASNTGANDLFGRSIALSTDGSTLAVGANGEDSPATGVGGSQTTNSVFESGAVYVFARSGATWSQEAYVKATNTGADDAFGVSVALSANGSTLAVGAIGEASAATGVGGNQADNTRLGSGAVYVYARSGAAWSPQAYVKASNTDTDDQFGYSVALSADGSILAVGALAEDGAATGVDGGNSNSAPDAGAVYAFGRSGAAWSQRGYVKASNTDITDLFGNSVALSADGLMLAVGAPNERSAATDVDGNQADNSAPSAGAVYVMY